MSLENRAQFNKLLKMVLRFSVSSGPLKRLRIKKDLFKISYNRKEFGGKIDLETTEIEINSNSQTGITHVTRIIDSQTGITHVTRIIDLLKSIMMFHISFGPLLNFKVEEEK